MEIVLVLLSILVVPTVIVVGFVAAIAGLFSRVQTLSRKLVVLDDRLATMERQRSAPTASADLPADAVTEEATSAGTPAETPPVVAEGPAVAPLAPVAPVARPVQPPRPPRRPLPKQKPLVLPSPERIALWVTAGIGGLAAVLTALFVLVEVVERGLLGPVMRVSLGLAGAGVLWVVGALVYRKMRAVGGALSGAGMGIAYGALYAGASLYELFPGWLGSAGMIGVTVVGMSRAVARRDRFTAWLALVGGLMTPWLLSTGENRAVALFLYLGMLSLGVIAAAVRRQWPDLVVGGAIGVSTLHIGWTATYYAQDQVPQGLFGVAIVTFPFLASLVLARGHEKRTTMVVAVVCATLLELLALPWVVPIDSVRFDPISGMTLLRTSPWTFPVAACCVALLPAFIAALGRTSLGRIAVIAGSVPGILLAMGFSAGWSTSEDPTGWIMVGAVGGVSLAALFLAGRVESRWLLPWVAGAAMAAGPAAVAASPPVAAGALLALVFAGMLASRSGQMGAGIPVTVLGAGSVAWAAAGVHGAHPALVGAILVSLTAVVQGSVMLRWREHGSLAWLGAAAAPVALFPALYLVWVDAFGDGLIGALPLGLAVYALVAGIVVARRQALQFDNVVVAGFTLVVLLGITSAVPLELRERWLTVAWALQAAALAYAHRHVRHPLLQFTAGALCVAVSVRLLLNPWALSWGTAAEGWPILNWTLYTWGVPALCIALCARWLPKPFAAPLGVLALAVGFGLVNVEVSHAFQDQGVLELASGNRLQSMVRSASWAAYGLCVLAGGMAFDARTIRLLGFLFVMLATVKVFALDLWDLQGFVRVGSIGCLAVALIIAAVAFERLVLRGRSPEVPPVDPQPKDDADMKVQT